MPASLGQSLRCCFLEAGRQTERAPASLPSGPAMGGDRWGAAGLPAMVEAVETLIKGLGDDVHREGLRDTPLVRTGKARGPRRADVSADSALPWVHLYTNGRRGCLAFPSVPARRGNFPRWGGTRRGGTPVPRPRRCGLCAFCMIGVRNGCGHRGFARDPPSCLLRHAHATLPQLGARVPGARVPSGSSHNCTSMRCITRVTPSASRALDPRACSGWPRRGWT